MQQLKVVAAVHDAGGFTAAAEALFVAQSSLSRTVADVERRLGAPLFERTTRRLQPTPVGREFVAMAHRAVAGVDAELRHFEGFLAGRAGRVRIATLPSLAAILLPGVVCAFQAARPEVRLSISDALADEVLDRVREGRADLAVTVVSAGTGPTDDLAIAPVATDRFCAIVPPGHRFAREAELGRTELGWAELASEPFIDFDVTTSIRQHVDRAFAAADASPRRVVAARNVAAVAGLVAAGLGVSAVPGLVVPLTGFAGLVAVPLQDPVTRREMAVVQPRSRPPTPAAAAFVELLTGPDRTRRPLPEHATWLDRAP